MDSETVLEAIWYSMWQNDTKNIKDPGAQTDVMACHGTSTQMRDAANVRQKSDHEVMKLQKIPGLQ